MAAEKKIVIIGAGPCGLGAGWALSDRGHDDWIILEKNNHVGGLSASFRDPEGFTWDIGGHVIFSHYPAFDQIINGVMGDDLIPHRRSSFVRCCNSWVPYPFQNNLSFLPPEAQLECLMALKEAGKGGRAKNFDEWIDLTFGEGIAKYFMRPYNRKVWGVPLDKMSAGWVEERVSLVDFDSTLRKVILKEEDSRWGPNEQFSFPRVGGTGEIFRRMASRFDEKIRLNCPVNGISTEEKVLYLSNGETQPYDVLISTVPLSSLVAMIKEATSSVKEMAGGLIHNSVLAVGLGFSSPLRDEDRCWFYFPGEKSPFYRVTNFAKYSHNNVPDGRVDRYTSYLCETSYSRFKDVDKEKIIDRTKRGLLDEGVIDEETFSKEVSRFLIDVEFGYPVPTLDRDEILKEVQSFLMERGIFSRGRFGAWRYEIGNMDYAVKMGLEVVDLILAAERERVWSI